MGRKDYLEERPSGLPRQRQGLPRRSLMVEELLLGYEKVQCILGAKRLSLDGVEIVASGVEREETRGSKLCGPR